MNTVIQVPTIDVRKRISPKVIAEIALQIAQRFKPQKIVLFGSYAYGTPRPESDIDLLVIMDTAIRETQQAQLIRQFLNPLFGLDLIVYSPSNLKKRLELGDQFLREITTRGKVLYESTDA